MQDYWDDKEKRLSILKLQNINKVITKNAIGLDFYENNIKDFIYLVNPSGYDDFIFKNLNIEKEYDILISGALCEQRYPMRSRLARIAKELSSDFKIYTRSHPGYFYNQYDIKNEQIDYCLDINKSKIAIASSAMTGLNVHMQKIWEISATSAICCTDLNVLEPDYNLLRQHVYEINMNKTDNEIKSDFLHILQNYDHFIKNIKSYNAIVESYANLENRTIQLLNCIKKLFNI
jgi:hypothetical protein